MEMSEAPISDRFNQAVRLTGLLRKILDDVHRSIKVLEEAVEGSSLPYVQVDHGDIELAEMYLRDLGFKNDGKHLYRAFWKLRNKCIYEWLAAIADGESQEFHRNQLIELFGEFPVREGPNDPTLADRKVAILGFALQFSDYLSGLISSVNASENPSEAEKPLQKMILAPFHLSADLIAQWGLDGGEGTLPEWLAPKLPLDADLKPQVVVPVDPMPPPPYSLDRTNRTLDWFGERFETIERNPFQVIGVLYDAFEKGSQWVTLDKLRDLCPDVRALDRGMAEVFIVRAKTGRGRNKKRVNTKHPVYEFIEKRGGAGAASYRLRPMDEIPV